MNNVLSKKQKITENCCSGMDRCIEKGWVEKDIIGDTKNNKIYYNIPTNKMDEDGHNFIGLILEYCVICSKRIYPD